MTLGALAAPLMFMLTGRKEAPALAGEHLHLQFGEISVQADRAFEDFENYATRWIIRDRRGIHEIEIIERNGEYSLAHALELAKEAVERWYKKDVNRD